MDYNRPNKSGRNAFLQGKLRSDNPCESRTNANARLEWDRGWVAQSQAECNGIEIGKGVFSGCTATGGDCPECGK